VFQQVPDPLGNLFLTWLVALIPVVVLLLLLAVFRVSAWLATLIGSLVTFLLAAWVWHMPVDSGVIAYLTKPLDLIELGQLFDSVAGSRQRVAR